MLRTSPTSLASNLRRPSDSSIVQRRWDPSEIRLMTREIGSFWLMQENTSRLAGMHRSDRLFALSIALLWLTGYGTERGDRQLYKLLSADKTGVTFANTITATDSLNVQTDVYIYNGAGVAVGDVDNAAARQGDQSPG